MIGIQTLVWVSWMLWPTGVASHTLPSYVIAVGLAWVVGALVIFPSIPRSRWVMGAIVSFATMPLAFGLACVSCVVVFAFSP